MKIAENTNLTKFSGSLHNVHQSTEQGLFMSQFDKAHLTTNFENWKSERCPELDNGDAFEIYAIEQVLKAKDPSDEDVESGNIGGGNDGGVDGFYFYIDNKLVKEGVKITSPVTSAELVIIQSKYSDAFEESPIHKLKKFSENCFDWGKSLDSVAYLKDEIKDLIMLFRSECERVMKDDPELMVTFYYVTKSTHAPSPNVKQLSEELTEYVESQLTHAKVAFKFWDCVEVLKSVRSNPSQTITIPTLSPLMTLDGSTVCLVKLTDYAKFLTDEKTGQINTSFLEPNVRDFQGSTGINEEIRETLQSTDSHPEFWWLNNGITIVAEECGYGAGQVKIKRPEIVNGLQTSHQIFESFKDSDKKDERHVLMRIIVTKDETTRNRVIKATNNQNPMSDLQIKSADPIHFDIQDALKRYGFWYDRRKGQSKRERRPLAKTVSPASLAQMVIAILLQRPSDARSRPKSTIESAYASIFNEKYDKRLYVACLLLHRQVSAFMDEVFPTEKDIRARLRYQVSMLSACALVNAGNPTAAQIASLTDSLVSPVNKDIFVKSLDVARKEYDNNPVDKYAKSVAFQEKLRSYAHEKYTLNPP